MPAGRVAGGEGVLGLQRAFQLAVSKNVVGPVYGTSVIGRRSL
jgi:hypothetical protein